MFASYAVAWAYLIGFIVAQFVYGLLSRHDQDALTVWASTSVHNLHHNPVGTLIVSAFVSGETPIVWPVLITLAMFGANHALGNWRLAVICVAGQVIGTLVSEGIVEYRVSRGALPPLDRYLIDVGPSYVVVSAVMVALLYGTWLARAAAALVVLIALALGHIFAGLSQLNYSAVGHLTAMLVGIVGGSLLVWQRRRRRLGGDGPAGARAGQPG
jgi:biotin transporter BioY